jgi:hypothetical protein
MDPDVGLLVLFGPPVFAVVAWFWIRMTSGRWIDAPPEAPEPGVPDAWREAGLEPASRSVATDPPQAPRSLDAP